jgi:hypothetical protein
VTATSSGPALPEGALSRAGTLLRLLLLAPAIAVAACAGDGAPGAGDAEALRQPVLRTPLDPPASPDEEPALQRLQEQLASLLRDLRGESYEEIVHLGGGWSRLRYEVTGTPEYDLTRTDSRVSPLVAVVEIPVDRKRTTYHPERADAEVDREFIDTRRELVQVYVGYADGAWRSSLARRSSPGSMSMPGWFDLPGDHPYWDAFFRSFPR